MNFAGGLAQSGDPYRVMGTISGHGGSYVAQLALVLENEALHRCRVLVTRRGVISELLYLPAAVRSAALESDAKEDMRDGGKGGRGSVVALDIKRISRWEYRCRQMWRVYRTFRQQPRVRRLAASLTLGSVVFDLEQAYAIAGRFRASIDVLTYPEWHQRFYGISARDHRAMQRRCRGWKAPPRFQVLILKRADTESQAAAATRLSLQRQTYHHFSIIEIAETELPGWLALDGTRALSGTAAFAPGLDMWSLFLREGTQLADSALYWIANTIQRNGSAGVVYTDEDAVDDAGRLSCARFKPDWSPELLRSTNYIGEAFAWRTSLLDALPCRSPPPGMAYADAVYALLLELTAGGAGVTHISAPLWHIASEAAACTDTLSSVASSTDACGVVARSLGRQEIAAEVIATGPGRCRVRYALPADAPRVTIVIPTRDGLHHLRRCVESVTRKTTYGNYELIIVDNQSVAPETHGYLDALRGYRNIRVLPFDEEFNYSRINNAAVAQAKGELICLLNNDTEIISADWLDEMVALAVQTGIGAVGAKLIYSDGTVQHGGDSVGPGGCADHLHSGIGMNDPGYAGRALLTQDLSAVTAACLLTRKGVFQALGGLDEANLPVAFNDVDFCLRVRAAGLRVVWTPHALLHHHESATRGKDVSEAQLARARGEVAYMRKRWPDAMRRDPFYNDNLSYVRPDFSLSAVPLIEKPW
jgi:GT2 family glycosyltransferase